MIILWSKYPDIYISEQDFETDRDAFGFTESGEHYIYSCITSFVYSEEDAKGGNPMRQYVSKYKLQMISV